MKEQLNNSQDKLVSLEEGCDDVNDRTFDLKSRGSGRVCNCTVRLIKLILYLELVLFVGWLSYVSWQAYRTQSVETKKLEDQLTTSKDQPFSSEARNTLNDEVLDIGDMMKNMENILKSIEEHEASEKKKDLDPNGDAKGFWKSFVNHEDDKVTDEVPEETSTVSAVGTDGIIEKPSGPFALKEPIFKTINFENTVKPEYSLLVSSNVDDPDEDSDRTKKEPGESSSIDNVEAEETKDLITQFPAKLEMTWPCKDEESKDPKIPKDRGEPERILTTDEISKPILVNGYLCSVKPWALHFYYEFRIILRTCEFHGTATSGIENSKKSMKSDVIKIDESKVENEGEPSVENTENLKKHEVLLVSILEELSSLLRDSDEDERELKDLESLLATDPTEPSRNPEVSSVQQFSSAFSNEKSSKVNLDNSIGMRRFISQFIVPELNLMFEESNKTNRYEIGSVDNNNNNNNNNKQQKPQSENVSTTPSRSSIDSEKIDKVDVDSEESSEETSLRSGVIWTSKTSSEEDEEDDEMAKISELRRALYKKSTDESSSIDNDGLHDMYTDDYDDYSADWEESTFDPEFTHEDIKKRSIEPPNENIQSTELQKNEEGNEQFNARSSKELLEEQKKIFDNGGYKNIDLLTTLNIIQFRTEAYLKRLAAHIDRLHKRYVKTNQLNDDYISKEFPSDFVEES